MNFTKKIGKNLLVHFLGGNEIPEGIIILTSQENTNNAWIMKIVKNKINAIKFWPVSPCKGTMDCNF